MVLHALCGLGVTSLPETHQVFPIYLRNFFSIPHLARQTSGKIKGKKWELKVAGSLAYRDAVHITNWIGPDGVSSEIEEELER